MIGEYDMAIDRNANIPLYKQIRDDLRCKIESGHFPTGKPIESEASLAEMYGVSTITVRNAILELVNEGLLYRVQGKGTFVQENTSAGRQSNLIGFVVPFFNEYVTSVMEGIERISQVFGYNLIIKNSNDNLDEERDNILELINSDVRGLIVWPVIPEVGAQPTDVLRQLRKERFPLVLVDQKLPGFDSSTVVSDNFGGAYQAVTHLVQTGAQRVGFVRQGPFLSSIRDRYDGYVAALLNHCIEYEESLVFSENAPENTDKFEEYLKCAKPEALFVQSDTVALGVKYALEKLGYGIPEEIKLVGFDDLESVRHLDVPLTTVAQLREDIGAFSARLLFGQIEGKDMVRHIVVPTRLVIRASTGVS